ncbi:DNA-processing protein DprA [Nocardioides sp. Root190]|uniref:DNA-processing protein DprA n=1 Tax=Nocardioides sp. Root190 TaxID=1736488 RepID=UPI00138F3D67|nr:DNA-processing protein DprA [Nocardioides sp. Root190]
MSSETLFDFGDPTPQGGDLRTAAGLQALMTLRGVGSGRAVKLASAFGSSEAFNAASPEARRRAAGTAVEGTVTVVDVIWPDTQIAVGYFDDTYPVALRSISDPPAVVTIRGSLPATRSVAVVGTRTPTPWGAEMASAIARDAVEAGLSVVSGLALGVDIAAHRAAVKAGGITVAVLGSGLDAISPRQHLRDAEEIVSSGGCLVTEQSPGTTASARTLVARNRLQTALSLGTVVVQCGATSGTMSTAEYALKQGRQLAVPVPPEAERSRPECSGSESLTGRGVRRLANRADLQEFLAGL